jgi:hypothetical protein
LPFNIGACRSQVRPTALFRHRRHRQNLWLARPAVEHSNEKAGVLTWIGSLLVVSGLVIVVLSQAS